MTWILGELECSVCGEHWTGLCEMPSQDGLTEPPPLECPACHHKAGHYIFNHDDTEEPETPHG